MRVVRSTRGEACSVQTISSAEGGLPLAATKSRAPASCEGRRAEQFAVCGCQCELSALGGVVAVTDQILGGERRSVVTVHMLIRFRIGPVGLQRAKLPLPALDMGSGISFRGDHRFG
jgi:hypothetical protein